MYYMGMNVHLLQHLSEMVLDLGPLGVYSCFFFEDLNGQLVKLIHGPHQPGLRSQIDRLPPQSAVRAFCESLSKVGNKFTTAEVVSPRLIIIKRKAFECNVSEASCQLLRDQWILKMVISNISFQLGKMESFSIVLGNHQVSSGVLCLLWSKEMI